MVVKTFKNYHTNETWPTLLSASCKNIRVHELWKWPKVTIKLDRDLGLCKCDKDVALLCYEPVKFIQMPLHLVTIYFDKKNFGAWSYPAGPCSHVVYLICRLWNILMTTPYLSFQPHSFTACRVSAKSGKSGKLGKSQGLHFIPSKVREKPGNLVIGQGKVREF